MTTHTLYSCASLSVLDDNTKHICIIPGNPGVKEYYYGFVNTLYDLMKDKYLNYYKISTTSHKGHSLEKNDRLYSLDDQIRYHEKIIREKQKTSDGMILIGHSIGCHIILELMANKEIRDKVDKAILLFPTIDRMDASPAGKRLRFRLNGFMQFLIQFILLLLCIFPRFFRARIARLFIKSVKSGGPSEMSINVTESITMKPSVLKQVFFMAKTELDEVIKPNIDVIQDCHDKLIFYYGQDDSWCPTEYYEYMKNRFPDAEIYLGRSGYRHDFVIDHSEEIANLTYMWITRIWKPVGATSKSS